MMIQPVHVLYVAFRAGAVAPFGKKEFGRSSLKIETVEMQKAKRFTRAGGVPLEDRWSRRRELARHHGVFSASVRNVLALY